MVEDRPEDTEPPPESGRAKRPPPTIELQATEVSGEAPDSGAGSRADAEPRRSSHWFRREVLSSIIIAAASGACAGALVIGIMWLSGWPNVEMPAAPAQPAINTAVVDDLAARLGRIESQIKNAPPSDSTSAARLEGLDKAVSQLGAGGPRRRSPGLDHRRQRHPFAGAAPIRGIPGSCRDQPANRGA